MEVPFLVKRKTLSFLLYYFLIVGTLVSLTFVSNKATTVVANKIPLRRNHTIIVDAGHGGEDGGATSCTGVLESSINLEIAARLNDLAKFLGFQTKMIRSSDVSVYTEGKTIAQKKVSDLKNRISLVNQTENAVLVSIHQNTFSDSQYSGGQVFYCSNEKSRQLAEQVQTAICQSVNKGSNRKCKPAEGVYLMQHVTCTGILVECGFLSNAEEEAKLRNEEYQKKVACVIASSVCKFLDRESEH